MAKTVLQQGGGRCHTSTINTQATLRLLHIFHVVTCNSNCRGSKWGLHGFCQRCSNYLLTAQINTRVKEVQKFFEFFDIYIKHEAFHKLLWNVVESWQDCKKQSKNMHMHICYVFQFLHVDDEIPDNAFRLLTFICSLKVCHHYCECALVWFAGIQVKCDKK